MSGIVGIVFASAARHPDSAVVDAMAARLTHAASESVNVYSCAGATLAAYGPGRDAGTTPLRAADARGLQLVCDGEIYNARELANQLAARGHVFRTAAYSEIIARAWTVRGRDALEHLDGVFGLAVWDEISATLVLARDRLGVRSLYYALLPDQIVFASDLRAILAHPDVRPEMNVDALAAYLAHGLVPAPQSIVRGVAKLPAGHRLVYSRGAATVERWWQAPRDGGPVQEVAAVAQVAAVLDLAVRQQLRADAPVGILLSGGLDSAAIAATARGHVGGRLRTVSVRFGDGMLDECDIARRVAEALDTDHHEHVAQPGTALRLVHEVSELVDEPLGDPSLLLSRLLAGAGNTAMPIALSGDGADEIFAGDPLYVRHRRARAWQRAPAALRTAAAAVIEAVPGLDRRLIDDLTVTDLLTGAGLGAVERHVAWTPYFDPQAQRALLTPEALAPLATPPSLSSAVYELVDGIPDSAWLDRVLAIDFRIRLAGVLHGLERTTAGGGLRVRAPFVDRRVVEVAAALPARMKLRRGRTKHILRQLMQGRLPSDVVARPHRRVQLPLARWSRGDLLPLLREVCDPAVLRRGGLFRPDAVQRLMDEHLRGHRDHGRRLYTLLVFLLWCRRHGV